MILTAINNQDVSLGGYHAGGQVVTAFPILEIPPAVTRGDANQPGWVARSERAKAVRNQAA